MLHPTERCAEETIKRRILNFQYCQEFAEGGKSRRRAQHKTKLQCSTGQGSCTDLLPPSSILSSDSAKCINGCGLPALQVSFRASCSKTPRLWTSNNSTKACKRQEKVRVIPTSLAITSRHAHHAHTPHPIPTIHITAVCARL